MTNTPSSLQAANVTAAPCPEVASSPMHAGGRATEAGMAFQSEVASWIAAHILTLLPIGGRFGLNNAAIPISIRLETGAGLDDIEVVMSDGGTIHVQCKTSANLSYAASGPLAKTIRQHAFWVRQASLAGERPDPIKSGAVLAVCADAPRTLDSLETGCRAFDLGGQWRETVAQRNHGERQALHVLEVVAKAAWETRQSSAPDSSDLAILARLFHLARFSMGEGDHDWREASQLLGQRMFGSESEGDAPLRDLKGILRGLISNGAPADRAGLLRALRQRGHQDLRAPVYDADIGRLKELTAQELVRLQKHGRISRGNGVRIVRQSDLPLDIAISTGSLLVIGEPGAGKTGALLHAAERISANGGEVVFLSVDRFPGVSIAADLDSEIGLQRPLLECLAAVPGHRPKVLFVDALDAARGGASEQVFAKLIEKVRANLTEWTVVSSVRTFDLKSGRRYREIFVGEPVDANYADPTLRSVRHFVVPRLSEADMIEVGAAVPEMQALLTVAPAQLRVLLTNIFNLSLAAQLLTDGANASTFGSISTQSGLIDAYEDARLGTVALRQAVRQAAAVMLARRRLAVRTVLIEHSSVDDAIHAGVLTVSGELVSFAHHVLFDHVAGRYFLDWDSPADLLIQLSGESSTALLLAPALRFAMERVWRGDGPGRPVTWQLLISIFATDRVDAVLRHVALRVVAENIDIDSDIGLLVSRVAGAPTQPALVALLSLLSRIVAIEVEGYSGLATSKAIVWARLAEALLDTHEQALLDPARFLLMTVFESADLADAELLDIFGRAARALLRTAWSGELQLMPLSNLAIRLVGKSFSSDPEASRILLDKILREPRFSMYADQEAGWLAEQILPITHSDPSFTAEIYRALFGQAITDNSITALGGQNSRIMPLTSNRQQDYRSALWSLGRDMADVLKISPRFGTLALINALIGQHDRNSHRGSHLPERVTIGLHEVELRGSLMELHSWDHPRRSHHDDDILRHYLEFLRTCDIAAFTSSVAAALNEYATVAVWTRIFGIGVERVAEVVPLLWPLVLHPSVHRVRGMRQAASKFAAAAWLSRTVEQRVDFERMILDQRNVGDEAAQLYWQGMAKGFFAVLDEDALSLEETREFRCMLMAQASDGVGHSPAIDEDDDHSAFLSTTTPRYGAALYAGASLSVHERSRSLLELVQQIQDQASRLQLAALWLGTMELIHLLDTSGELEGQVELEAWGHVSKAIECIASCENYDPSAEGLPTLLEMFSLLSRLSASPFPQPQAPEPGRMLSWGNWDVRVYAAGAWMWLASRFAVHHPNIVSHLDAALVDPVDTVRLQVAQNLQVISDADASLMWTLARRIAATESNPQVIATYLNRSLVRFAQSSPELCEEVLAIVKCRLAGDLNVNAGAQSDLEESFGSWIAILFVSQGRPLARAWLLELASEPLFHGDALRHLLYSLRTPLFARYASNAGTDSRDICDRAQECLAIILAQAHVVAEEAYSILRSDAEEPIKIESRQRYRGAVLVAHNAMNQLFFGSGAYAAQQAIRRAIQTTDDADTPGLQGIEPMARFMVDYAEILINMGRSREPSTLHYLIELYEFLIPCNPAAVFDAIHTILLGTAREEGYQLESLGSDAVVRIVKRYIAEYRSIFEEDGRRARLVEMLRLFSEVGWPKALRLLFDLPELLR